MLNIKNTKPEEWVPRDTVCEELKIKKSTFRVYLSTGKIPADAIRKGIVKVFHLPTLKGLTKSIS